VRVDHAWGMTEVSPLGAYNRPKPGTENLAREAMYRLNENRAARRSRGSAHRRRCGGELPWTAWLRHLQVRALGVSAYFGNEPGSALTPDGWFATGDVATIDADG